MIAKQDFKFKCRRYVLNENKELDYNKSGFLAGEGWEATYTLDVVDGDTTSAIIKRLFNINGDTFNTQNHRYAVVRDCYRVDLDRFFYDADTNTYFYNIWVADGCTKDYILMWESRYLDECRDAFNLFKKEHAKHRAEVLSRLKELYGNDYSKKHHAYLGANNYHKIVSVYAKQIKVITTLDDDWCCTTSYQYLGKSFRNLSNLKTALK